MASPSAPPGSCAAPRHGRRRVGRALPAALLAASAGATPVVWTLFPNDALTITGTPVSYQSSPGSTRKFCGTCGTGMFFVNETIFPNQTDIQAGTFDDKDAYPPQVHIQVAEAPAWIDRHGDLPRFERFPGG